MPTKVGTHAFCRSNQAWSRAFAHRDGHTLAPRANNNVGRYELPPEQPARLQQPRIPFIRLHPPASALKSLP
jgi:hypothetical protein